MKSFVERTTTALLVCVVICGSCPWPQHYVHLCDKLPRNLHVISNIRQRGRLPLYVRIRHDPSSQGMLFLDEKLQNLALRGGGQITESADDKMEVDRGEGIAAALPDVRQVTVRWKAKSLDLSINLGMPCAKLKDNLWELTDVLPEHQFLIGVYNKGKDVDLSSLGIKDGQNLVLLGEATYGSFSRHQGVVEEVASTTPPNSLPSEFKKGFFSFARLTKEQIKELDIEDETMYDTVGHDNENVTTNETRAKTHLPLPGTITSWHGTPEELAENFNKSQAARLANVSTTLPRELWGKPLANLTTEEDSLLKSWLNKTRTWKIKTKMEHHVAKKLNQTRDMKAFRDEETRKTDAVVDQLEKEHNEWGLSPMKARVMDFVHPYIEVTDYIENRTTYEEIKPFVTGGLTWEDSARFVEYWDEISACMIHKFRDDIKDDFERRRWLQSIEPELERRAREEESEPSVSEEITDVFWDNWVAYLKNHPYYPEYVRKLSEDRSYIPPSHPIYKFSRQPFPNIVQMVEDRPRKNVTRNWIAYSWITSTKLPNGLVNIGNTCYMSAGIQLLRCVPELMFQLKGWQKNIRNRGLDENLVEAARSMYQELADKESATAPYTFMHHLRQLVPRFAQMGPMGPQQQDADECLNEILASFKKTLKTPTGSNLVEHLFEVELDTQTWCIESMTEEPTYETSRLLRLPLPIDKHCHTVHDCLDKLFTSQLEKYSPTLNRTAMYNTSTEITRLPPYLLLNFMRFYWRTDVNKKAKICRSVYFPMTIDLLDYLSEDLRVPIQVNLAKRKAKFFQKKTMWQEKDIDEMPRKWAEWDRAQAEKELMVQMGYWNATTTDEDEEEDASSPKNNTEFDLARERWLKDIQAAEFKLNTSNPLHLSPADASLEGLSASHVRDSAMYQLRAVLAHQSRYAEAGHYICYIATGMAASQAYNKAPENIWMKFDDDKVSWVREDEVKNTAGGADNPISYICLYARSEDIAEGLSSTLDLTAT